ncbi:FAD-dependent monooxygenase [Streptomyces sp. NPDC052020]|uniref:FAD-dependent monooxygenase n=1 Tax=Streptomyces sp. NPDC052020 TaxID=3155677 RepID=UPI00341463BA
MTPPLDVLVVGAGPTGLALALQLHAWKVPFRIVDRAPGPARESGRVRGTGCPTSRAAFRPVRPPRPGTCCWPGRRTGGPTSASPRSWRGARS